jgi:hypothetical protein
MRSAFSILLFSANYSRHVAQKDPNIESHSHCIENRELQTNTKVNINKRMGIYNNIKYNNNKLTNNYNNNMIYT